MECLVDLCDWFIPEYPQFLRWDNLRVLLWSHGARHLFYLKLVS